MTKVTLEDENGRYTVEVHDDGLSCGDMLERLIEPVLRAAGYHEKNVEEAIKASAFSGNHER